MKDALLIVSEQLGVNSDLRALQEYFDKASSVLHLYVPRFDINSQVTLKFNLNNAVLEFQVTVLDFEEIEYDADHDYGSYTQEVLSVLKVGGDLSDFINAKLEAGVLCIEHEIELRREEPDCPDYDYDDNYESSRDYLLHEYGEDYYNRD